jgi:hypothetical protein
MKAEEFATRISIRVSRRGRQESGWMTGRSRARALEMTPRVILAHQ